MTQKAVVLSMVTQVRNRLAVSGLMVVLAVVVALTPVQEALGAQDWAPVRPIPGFLSRTLPPIMIADGNHTVHAFVSQYVGDGDDEEDYVDRVIIYRQWTLADGWSDLNDIIISPLKTQARVKAVHLDNAGFFHLIFYGGDEQEANLYYTSAPAALAGNAHAWTEPVAIGPSPITPDVAGLVGDGKGNMVMVYSGNLGEGNSLYAVYSFDEGVTWTAPERVFSTFTSTEKAFDFQLNYGESGAVHMVWNVTDKTGKNVAGYYARLDQLTPDGKWSEAVPLAPSVQLGVAIPAVTEYNGEVFVMYNNGLGESVAPVQWFQRSSDGGVTWSEPIRPFPSHIGRNGSISFVKDGGGALHVFFGQRIPSGGDEKNDVHGMWHATWLGGSWGPLEPVVSGNPRDDFDPYDANAVVSQGNVILTTWRTDPGRPVNGVFYSYAQVDAPEIPVVMLPVPTPTPTPPRKPAPPTATSDALLLGTTPVAVAPGALNSAQPLEKPGNPGAPLVVGVAPALVMTAGFLLVAYVWRRRS